jgi:hypothetical protein
MAITFAMQDQGALTSAYHSHVPSRNGGIVHTEQQKVHHLPVDTRADMKAACSCTVYHKFC